MKQQSETDTQQYNNEIRESIWTIRSQWYASYIYLFSIQTLAGTGYAIWHEIARRTDDGIYETFSAIIEQTGRIGVASAAISIAITEVLNDIMVTGEWMRQKLVEPLKEKQRQEGRAEGLAEGREKGRVEGRAEGLEEGLEEGRAEGLEEGREEAHIEWREWIERKTQAEAKGEQFDEPMPDARSRAQDQNGSKE